MEQGQEPGLPEGVTPVHQLVAAALEAALEAHLPMGHPALCGRDRSGWQCRDEDPLWPRPPPKPSEIRGAAHQQAPEIQEMFLFEDDQRRHAAEGVTAVRLHPRHPADAALPVLAPARAQGS